MYSVVNGGEQGFLSEVRDLPIQKRESLGPDGVAALTPAVNAAMDRMDRLSVVCAYQVFVVVVVFVVLVGG